MHHTPTNDVEPTARTILVADLIGPSWAGCRPQDRAALVERILDRCGGRAVDGRGHALVAVFDGPCGAIHAAQALSRAARAKGLQVRVAIHSGTVDGQGAHLTGLPFLVGSRVADLAEADEVLVSAAVAGAAASRGRGPDRSGRARAQGRARPLAALLGPMSELRGAQRSRNAVPAGWGHDRSTDPRPGAPPAHPRSRDGPDGGADLPREPVRAGPACPRARSWSSRAWCPSRCCSWCPARVEVAVPGREAAERVGAGGLVGLTAQRQGDRAPRAGGRGLREPRC